MESRSLERGDVPAYLDTWFARPRKEGEATAAILSSCSKSGEECQAGLLRAATRPSEDSEMIASAEREDLGWKLERVGEGLIRYGLAAILIWVGLLKFTAYEAEAIEPLVANSPFLSWGYRVASVQGFAMLIGVAEIVFGLLIAARRFSPRLSAFGSFGAILMFLTTLSFTLTTPGVWQPGYGFPFPSPMPGQFLAKDLALLAAAVWTAGESLRAARHVEPGSQASVVS